jgi:hypothetical protein
MEIPIPRLPTDNLYKFVALSGVLLVIVGYGIPAYSLVRSSALARPILREQVERIARQKVMISQYERSTAAYKKNDAAAGRALYDSANRLNDSLKRTSPLADEAFDEVKEDRDLLNDFVKVGFLLVAIGGICAIWGFTNWYTKLQRPLDEIISREAKGLEALEDKAPSGEAE